MRAYFVEVGAGLSHLLNALTGGKAANSFSARTGLALSQGKLWAKVVAKVIDTLLFSRNHCAEKAREEGLTVA